MGYQASWYPFKEHPDSDSCWSLSVGPDGRIYAASCCERMPGQTVKVVRYDEKTDFLEYLFDMDKMVDDPRDSGRATHCKIHYSFAPSLSDGVLYMATHLSGPPIDRPVYSQVPVCIVPEESITRTQLQSLRTKPIPIRLTLWL